MIPQIPETAPFDAAQRMWLNGFLAGLFQTESASAASRPAAPALGPLLFLWGSQTGGAEMLARKFAKDAADRGFAARAVGLEAHAEIDLAAQKRVAIVTSTYGDGEMPDNAQAFWDFLRNGSAPRLDELEFSVLALGDVNYVQFCEAGKRFDARLEELGARRIHPRSDCDVDYDAPAQQWFEGVMAAFGAGENATTAPASIAETATYSKGNPYRAVLKTNRLLNGPGSTKETRHFEILLGDSLAYEAGDALGVHPENCPEFVQEILASSGLDGEEAVPTSAGSETSLRLALQHHFDLGPFLAKIPGKATSVADLVAPLRKLQPRLYSISSSPKAHPGEVHLTVGIVRYTVDGRACKGVCSTFLADRVASGGNVPVFVHRSPHFRVPTDGATPIIMVGPGTGIAPFRAFLQERRASGAAGKNWLFFGEQRAATDFLYRDELIAWRDDGHLSRLDLAFSRDQAGKIYVQHRMLEHAHELWAWLQEGAHFYVCGDAKRMAKDVDDTLHRIVETAGGLSPEAAEEYVRQLKTEKRYGRDVY